MSSFSGGAHCCTTYLIYPQDGGRLENMGILDMGDYGVGFYDLNGDGNKEVMVQSDNLAYYDWSYAESLDLKTVLGWDGLRLADRTRFYAYLPMQNTAYYLRQARAVSSNDATAFSSLKSQVSGYFGNMILAGKGLEAEKLIREAFLPRSVLLKAWWPAHRGELIGHLRPAGSENQRQQRSRMAEAQREHRRALTNHGHSVPLAPCDRGALHSHEMNSREMRRRSSRVRGRPRDTRLSALGSTREFAQAL